MLHLTKKNKIKTKSAISCQLFSSVNCQLSNVNCCQKGIATLEMLIAMSLMVIVISTVLPLVSGGQDMSVSSETNQEALYKAQSLLEEARANAKLDFNLVNPINAIQDDIYQKSLSVTHIGLFTKKVTSTLTWSEGGRNLSVNLTTYLTNPNAIGGGDTCSSVLSGDWTNPQKTEYEFGADILNDPDSGFPISSIQAFNHKLYVTIGDGSAILNGNNQGTFFILDITNPASNPVLLSPQSFDNNPAVSVGLSAVAFDGTKYAYVANGYGAPYTTCTNPGGGNYSCGQLQVIDVSNPANPSMQYSYKIPGVTGTSGQGIGVSIFYKAGVVYLGLAKATGPEFNIIDVGGLGTPGAAPTNPIKVGSFEVGSAVNAIFVRNGYAYIASPDDEELKILDVSTDPYLPSQVGNFNAPGGGANNGNGKSLALVGDTLYLGRTLLSGDELFVLNNSNPVTTLPSLGSKNIQDAGNNTSVNGMIIRDNLSFLITNEQFQILDIDNPANITQYATPLLLPPGSGNVSGTAADCEANYFFIGSQGSNDKGYISTITSGP